MSGDDRVMAKSTASAGTILELNIDSKPAFHGSERLVAGSEIWTQHNDPAQWKSIDWVMVRPGSSVKYDKHDVDHEVYTILKGAGMIIMEDRTYRVRQGDLILNSLRESPVLVNDSGKNLDILITEIQALE